VLYYNAASGAIGAVVLQQGPPIFVLPLANPSGNAF
jgi:hypothetical protein